MVTSPEEEKSEVWLFIELLYIKLTYFLVLKATLKAADTCCVQVAIYYVQVTMRTESEEREVVEGGGGLPPVEEARKPDPCTEGGMKYFSLKGCWVVAEEVMFVTIASRNYILL